MNFQINRFYNSFVLTFYFSLSHLFDKVIHNNQIIEQSLKIYLRLVTESYFTEAFFCSVLIVAPGDIRKGTCTQSLYFATSALFLESSFDAISIS